MTLCRLMCCAATCAAFVLGSGQSRAQGKPDDALLSSLSFRSAGGPVHIRSDRLEFRYKQRELTYYGNVRVAQADVQLDANTLRIVLEGDEQLRVRQVIAEGGVKVRQGDRLATGGRAIFDQATRTVVLSEDAVLRDAQNQVAGDRITVYLDEKRVAVEGRVEARLVPPSGETPASVGERPNEGTR